MTDVTVTPAIVINRAARCLAALAAAPKDPALIAAAASWAGPLAEVADTLMISRLPQPAHLTGAATGQRGPARKAYIVDHERDGRTLIYGLAAAAAASGLAYQSMANALAKRGSYGFTERSADGEWSVNVRRAKPGEEAELTGTPDA